MATTPYEFEYNDAEQAEAAAAIAKLVATYKAKYGCGEPAGCLTCDVAVAIGLEHLDAAFNAGHAAAKAT